MKLFQDDHDKIIGKAYKYINTAVLIPIVQINGEDNFIFQQRCPDIPQGDEICFPGGKYDKTKDTSLQDTAIRETCEEMGVEADRITIRDKLGTIVSLSGVTVDAFVGSIRIHGIDELKINRREVRKAFCIPVDWFIKNRELEYSVKIKIYPYHENQEEQREYLLPAKEIGLPEKYEHPWDGWKYPVFAYRMVHGVIWGITAELIREFLENKYLT